MSKILFMLRALILPDTKSYKRHETELSCVPEGSSRHE